MKKKHHKMSEGAVNLARFQGKSKMPGYKNVQLANPQGTPLQMPEDKQMTSKKSHAQMDKTAGAADKSVKNYAKKTHGKSMKHGGLASKGSQGGPKKGHKKSM